MRYTENKYKTELADVRDLIVLAFTSVLLSPLRLIGEITDKVMYLNREFIEKLLLVSAGVNFAFILWDALVFLVTGKISLFGGMIPLAAKLASLLVIGALSFFALNKMEYSYIFVAPAPKVSEEPSVDREEIHSLDTSEVGPNRRIEVEKEEYKGLEEQGTLEPDIRISDDVEEPRRTITLEDLGSRLETDNIISISDQDEGQSSPLSLGGLEELPVLQEINAEVLSAMLSEDTVFSSKGMSTLLHSISKDRVLALDDADDTKEVS